MQLNPPRFPSPLGLLRFALGERGGSRAFPSWPRARPARWLRLVLVAGLVVPFLRLAYRIDVRGAEHLAAAPEPCLLVSNHNMHLDWGMLLCAFPANFRRRLAVGAAASEIFGNPARAFPSRLLGNAFPFAKEGSGVRQSLQFVPRMLDEGWNVLIFPEGGISLDGQMQPFKPGIGWLVAHTGVEVLPIRIDLLRPGFYEGSWWRLPRGHVRVTVAPAVRSEPGLSYDEIAAGLDRAVRSA